MANNTNNVVAGHPLSTGGVLYAPTGTALPTDTSTALNVAFVIAGYIDKAGLEKNLKRNTDQIEAWGTDIVKVTQTSFGVDYQFTFIESLNPIALKAAFNSSNVTSTAANGSHGVLQAVKINSLQLEHKSWVFEIRDGIAKIRLVVPDGQVTDVAQVKYSDADLVGWKVTVSAYPNSAGDFSYMYTDDGVTV